MYIGIECKVTWNRGIQVGESRAGGVISGAIIRLNRVAFAHHNLPFLMLLLADDYAYKHS